MIQESFIFLDRIGAERERRIWQSGCHTWNEFLSRSTVTGMSGRVKLVHDARLTIAKKALWQENAEQLAQLLPMQEHWRLYNHFKDDALFLDIETEGYYGNITVIGAFDGRETHTLLQGKDLEKKNIQRILAGKKLLVTYNGRSFDVPVIKRYFNIPELATIPHLDLRGVCSRLGWTGGLKAVEQRLGIARPESLRTVTGKDAANLWHVFKATGDSYYLDLLQQYNEEDVVNLQRVADTSVKELWKKLRFTQTARLV